MASKNCRQAALYNCMPEGFFHDLVKNICSTYADGKGINLYDDFRLPHRAEIQELIEDLLEVVFPGYREESDYQAKTLEFSIGHLIHKIHDTLLHLVCDAYHFKCHDKGCPECDVESCAANGVRKLLESIAPMREITKQDVKIAFENDPAAFNEDEIVLSYPGIKAIVIQRFANVLYKEGVPLIPRMMTEYAHSLTGIDIHPGAQLGSGVFIDHGTGVVIGETAIIGNNVKIYQGVTLGALNFPKDACGMIIKGCSRHPKIEDNVTIYAGATVLGNITIGQDSVLGGNVWITDSLPAGSKVLAQRK